MIEEHLFYASGWLSFAVIHSVLARDTAKASLKPLFSAYYRLAYNVFALVHLGAIYALGLWLYGASSGFVRPDALVWGQIGVYLLGWGLMLLALREYDLGILSGLKQVREHFKGVMAHDEEPLHFTGFHRWVRHPLYSAGFLILWGRVDSSFDVMTALCGSLYLWIGSVFEERHLIRLHGDHYATYKSRVPAFVPFKGKVDLKEPKP